MLEKAAVSCLHRWVLVLCLVLGAGPARAQENQVKTGVPDVDVTLRGNLQARLSYGWTSNTPVERERVGFGLRRARLIVDAAVGPHAGLFLQVDGASGSVQMVDVYAFYHVTDRLRLRLGRIASAQPRALILTSSTQIDAVDRAAVAETWGSRTIGADGRDFGFDLRYSAEQGEAILFVHNGDGDWGRARGNFRDAVTGDVTGGVDRSLRNLAVSFYSHFRPTGLPGVELGGFAGYNGARNPNTEAGDRGRDYFSYAAHLYWGAVPGSQPVRLKADFIGIRYETLAGAAPGVRDQHAVGFAVLGAVRVQRAAEVFARYEQYDPNVNRSGRGIVYLTGGASFSPSAARGRPYPRERLTLAYSAQFPDDGGLPDQHLLILQAQVTF